MTDVRHVPVLKAQVLSALDPRGARLWVDGTTGEGGHAEAVLQMDGAVRLICLDADRSIQEKARLRLAPWVDRTTFIHAWFDDWFAAGAEGLRPDRILLDLGISMFHYEDSERGFSFRKDEPLDMRLDPSAGPSAADLVNSLGERELADLIFQFGEERFSRGIARALVTRRALTPFTGAADLARVVEGAVPAAYRHGRLHAATKTFQALRIAVNRELERLERVLAAAWKVLPVGGRLGIITFHSLEDRLVKQTFREWARDCVCPPSQWTCVCGGRPLAEAGRALGPDDEEVRLNPPSRSAKLRVALKLREERGHV